MDFLSNLWSGVKNTVSGIGSALAPNMSVAPKTTTSADVFSLYKNAQNALGSSLSGTNTALKSINTPYQSFAPTTTAPTVRNISPTVVATPYAPSYNPYQSVAPQPQFAGSVITPYQSTPNQTQSYTEPTPSYSSTNFSAPTPTAIRGGAGQANQEIMSYNTQALNPYSYSGPSTASINQNYNSPKTGLGVVGAVPGSSFGQGALMVDQQEEQKKKEKGGSMSDFQKFAQSQGFQINPQTGEVINPSQQLISQFNQQFTTTSPSQVGTSGFQNTGKVLSEQQLNQMFNTASGSPLQIGGGAYKFAGREYIPQRNQDGSTSFIERTGASGVGGALSQANVPTTGGAVDLSKLTSRVGDISKTLDLIKQGKVPNAQEALSMFQKELEGSLQQIQTQNPIPPTPVVDTAEQQNFLNMLESTQQNTVRQQMDEVRLKLGLPQLEAQRLQALQNIQALNDSFKKITDEIKNNSDLPKSLAQRQIQEFAKTSQGLIDSYNSQLQIANQQISDANSALNQEFKIIETEQSLKQQAIDDNRQILKSLIDTKAIGEYDNAQIGELAQATGYSVASLKAMQKAVKAKADQYTNIQYITDDRGNVTVAGIDENGQPVRLGTLGQVGKADKPVVASSGEYSSAQEKIIAGVNDNVSKNATYTKTTSMRNFANNVEAALSQGNGVADIAAINQFQKVIDEGAVTRDQDVKLIQSAQSLANTLQTKITGLQKGDKLSPDQRNQMKTLVQQMYNTQIKALEKDPYISSETKRVERNGIKVDDTILGELRSFTSANQAPTTGIVVNTPSGAYTFKDQATADAYKKEVGLK